MLKNWKRHISIVLIFSLGFFLIPNSSYACSKKESKTEKSVSSNKDDGRSKDKDCVKVKSCENGNHHKDCNGKCKHSNCRCVQIAPSFAIFPQTYFKTHFQLVEFSVQKFDSDLSNPSPGFYNIWTPPNIG